MDLPEGDLRALNHQEERPLHFLGGTTANTLFHGRTTLNIYLSENIHVYAYYAMYILKGSNLTAAAVFFSGSLGLQHNFWCSEGRRFDEHQGFHINHSESGDDPQRYVFGFIQGHSGNLVTKTCSPFPCANTQIWHTSNAGSGAKISAALGKTEHFSITDHCGALEPWLFISKTWNAIGSRMIISKVMFHMHPSLQNPELVLTLDFKCAITCHCPSAM